MTKWERFFYGSVAVALILFTAGCAGVGSLAKCVALEGTSKRCN